MMISKFIISLKESQDTIQSKLAKDFPKYEKIKVKMHS